jgi:hypothetical protein
LWHDILIVDTEDLKDLKDILRDLPHEGDLNDGLILLQVNIGSCDKIRERLNDLWCVKVVSQALMNSGLHPGKDLIELVVPLIPLLLCIFKIALAEDSFDVLEELRELPLLLNSLRHRLLSGVVHQVVPTVQQEEHSDLASCVLCQNVLDSDEVFEGLGHFLAHDVQVTSVQKVVYPLVTLIVGLGLRYLVVVMWEAKVDPA